MNAVYISYTILAVLATHVTFSSLGESPTACCVAITGQANQPWGKMGAYFRQKSPFRVIRHAAALGVWPWVTSTLDRGRPIAYTVSNILVHGDYEHKMTNARPLIQTDQTLNSFG